MGTTPMMLGNLIEGYRLNRRRAVYVTMAELYIWAQNITATTEEGQPYHDALSIWNTTFEKIANLFDGSETITLPDGTTASAPIIVKPKGTEQFDAVSRELIYDNNTRFANWPLFPLVQSYRPDNDAEWYTVLKVICGRAENYAYTQSVGIMRQYKALLMEYNPTADYWKKTRKQGGNAPYASITDTNGPAVSSWTASNGKSAYKSENAIDSGNPVTTTNETTTFDSTSFRNVDKSTQTGKTTNTNEIPNSAYFENVDEEGETSGTPIADLIAKELELSKAYGDIYKSFMKGLKGEILLQYWRGA